jgi:hypothetical protein
VAGKQASSLACCIYSTIYTNSLSAISTFSDRVYIYIVFLICVCVLAGFCRKKKKKLSPPAATTINIGILFLIAR